MCARLNSPKLAQRLIRWQRLAAGMCVAVGLSAGTVWADTVVYQEGFNTDGDGTRYEMGGRGAEVGPAGPGMWEHNFLVSKIGLVDTAPAKRAAIVWDHAAFADVWTDEAFSTFQSLVSWATDNKPAARIGFFPGFSNAESSNQLADYFTSAGYDVSEIPTAADIPAAANLDLVIHTSEAAPDPPTAFINYPVPVIAFNAGNHDDTAIAGLGTVMTYDAPAELHVVAANAGHPALGGKTGTIPWTNDAASLQGIGRVPPGGKVLATIEDPTTGEDQPALVTIDKGGKLLGSFSAVPDGGGFIVGGDLNEVYGGGDGASPRTLDIGPINVTGKTDLKLTIALAATDADFENNDYLNVLIDPNGSGNYQTLSHFEGQPDKSMSDGTTVLSPLAFKNVTWALPAGATNLSIRFEAFNTFPNEIVAIDNLKIVAPGGLRGDFNSDGVLDAADIDALTTQSASGANAAAYDLTSDGKVDSSDVTEWIKATDIKKSWVGDADLDGSFDSNDLVAVLIVGKYETGQAAVWSEGDFDGDGSFTSGDLVAALVDGGYEVGPRAAVSAVPEPAALTLTSLGLLALMGVRRRV